MTVRERILSGAAVAVLLAPSLTSCRDAALPAPTPRAAVKVDVVRVSRGPIARTLVIPAEVRPYAQAVLYAKVAGYLKSIRVDEGDSVREGELLAEIEAPELAADLERQKTELAVAELAYKRLAEAQTKAPDLVMPQALDDAKGRRDIAQAALARTQTLLSYTRILSPLSGFVTKRSVDPGAFIPAATSGVSQSAALLTVMDIRTVRIEVPVPESEVPLVEKGLPVEVAVDELPGREFRGRITRFAYALDGPTKTMNAEAEIPNPRNELRPGMYARVRLAIERRPDALLLPVAAVVGGKGGDSVFTLAEGKAKRVVVKTGFRDDTHVEIRTGLDAGQAVIVPGASPPSDGQMVVVAESR